MTKFQIAVLSILGLIACVVIVGIGVIAYTFRAAAPPAAPQSETVPEPTATDSPPAVGPTPTFIRYEFVGEGDKVENFTVYADTPTFINTAHITERPTQLFTVDIKDSSGKTVSFAIAAQGNVDSEKVLNLPPGDYFAEIHGASWVVVISPGQ